MRQIPVDVMADECDGHTRTLAELFQHSHGSIGVSRCQHLFREMDSRSLTEEEEAIIQKRVQAQQDMLREYEKRDRKRKARMRTAKGKKNVVGWKKEMEVD